MWAIGWVLLNTWSTFVVWKTYFNSSVQKGSKLSRRFKKVWLGLKMVTEDFVRLILSLLCTSAELRGFNCGSSIIYHIKNESIKSGTKLPLRKTSKRGVMKRKEQSFLKSIRWSPKLYRRETLLTDWVWSSRLFILPSRQINRSTDNNFSLINMKYFMFKKCIKVSVSVFKLFFIEIIVLK